MRPLVLALGIVLLTGAAAPPLSSSGGALQRRLEAGDMAPDFALLGSDGKTHRLSDYRGKQAVVLAWFARAGSAG